MTYLNTLAAIALAAVSFAAAQPVAAQPGNCPPGLAKKNPPCVPPGQAKKGVTTQEWLNRHRIGERVDPEDVDWIDDISRLNLPPLTDGSRYAVIDGMLVALDADSYELLQLVRKAAAVFQ
ncbi:hypothetical protein SAMN04488020_101276 [Palleronia marisminoris]|uniref:Uncharacterized protein n=1 Tax=Palleronia marisminoris TaxID=315423 RepID=A0A1Y5REZ7_9RHOB|nr:hypothetical protein [Palleronia marisminoris]SFG13654.1 hypothetical protein SAMN04488020_101276 [Palleronia marisminoris]SLN14704.1 hypothetical protein PAM7066_00277 [Palleronia marisminoris]